MRRMQECLTDNAGESRPTWAAYKVVGSASWMIENRQGGVTTKFSINMLAARSASMSGDPRRMRVLEFQPASAT